jgi:hypothetical protein
MISTLSTPDRTCGPLIGTDALFLEAKLPEREGDHSLTASGDRKNALAYISIPTNVSMM